MHFRNTSALLALALLSVSSLALADTKIMIVRTDDMMRESPLVKAAQAKMKALFEKRGADLDVQIKQFQTDGEAFQRDNAIMTLDQKAKRQKELQTREVDIGLAQRKLQEDAAKQNQELLEDMNDKFRSVIEQVAKEKGADIVLQNPVYAVPAVDITGDVVKRLSSGAGGK